MPDETDGIALAWRNWLLLTLQNVFQCRQTLTALLPAP